MEDVGGAIGRVLRGEALRNMAKSLFPAFYERGYSANQALKTLRELGLGYRRQDFLRDYAAGKSLYERGTTVRFVNRDAVPSDDIMRPQYHGLPDKYGYLVRLKTIDADGNWQTKYRWYFTDYKGTRGEIEDRIRESFDNPELYEEMIVNVTLMRADINPYWVEF